MGTMFARYRSKVAQSSLKEYVIRLEKDTKLNDDVEAFLSKRDTSINTLADKLLNNDFARQRYCEPQHMV